MPSQHDVAPSAIVLAKAAAITNFRRYSYSQTTAVIAAAKYVVALPPTTQFHSLLCNGQTILTAWSNNP